MTKKVNESTKVSAQQNVDASVLANRIDFAKDYCKKNDYNCSHLIDFYKDLSERQAEGRDFDDVNYHLSLAMKDALNSKELVNNFLNELTAPVADSDFNYQQSVRGMCQMLNRVVQQIAIIGDTIEDMHLNAQQYFTEKEDVCDTTRELLMASIRSAFVDYCKLNLEMAVYNFSETIHCLKIHKYTVVDVAEEFAKAMTEWYGLEITVEDFAQEEYRDDCVLGAIQDVFSEIRSYFKK